MSSKVIRASKIANGPIMPMADVNSSLHALKTLSLLKLLLPVSEVAFSGINFRWWETSLALKSLKLIVIIKKYSTRPFVCFTSSFFAL